jgi:hypothetical protein
MQIPQVRRYRHGDFLEPHVVIQRQEKRFQFCNAARLLPFCQYSIASAWGLLTLFGRQRRSPIVLTSLRPDQALFACRCLPALDLTPGMIRMSH